MRHTFEVFTDFHQFLVADPAVDWSSLSDLWTDTTIDRMFVQGNGYIAVGTARDMTAPITLAIADGQPDEPTGSPPVFSGSGAGPDPRAEIR